MQNSYSEAYAAHQRLKSYHTEAEQDRLAAQLRRRKHSLVTRTLAWFGSLLERSGAALRRRYADPMPADEPRVHLA